MAAKKPNVPKSKQAGPNQGNMWVGKKPCGDPTRSGGKCVLTMGHSGGHKKA